MPIAVMKQESIEQTCQAIALQCGKLSQSRFPMLLNQSRIWQLYSGWDRNIGNIIPILRTSFG